MCGEKTATASLLREYEDGKPMPSVGALSVLEDGTRKPVCVVKTVWVEVIAFDQVDALFAVEYSETDGTLEGWREMCWEYYSDVCAEMGRGMSKDEPLVCERFRVIFS